jgi:hypothetical protein
MEAVARDVYLTISYEYLPKKPEGFKNIKAIWLDVTNCGASDVAPKTDTTFSVSMKPWTSDFAGPLLGTGGHLHDGGVDVVAYHNDQVICDSKATYGGPGYVEPAGTMAGMDTMQHISKMSGCTNMGDLKVGDKIHITANYDFTKHAGMKNTAGALSDVMGISVMYAAVDMP